MWMMSGWNQAYHIRALTLLTRTWISQNSAKVPLANPTMEPLTLRFQVVSTSHLSRILIAVCHNLRFAFCYINNDLICIMHGMIAYKKQSYVARPLRHLHIT